MSIEIARRLVDDKWVTGPVDEGGGGGPGSTPDLAAVLAEGADAGSVAITGLADPTNDQDAATKAYVDAGGGSAWDEHTLSTDEADWTSDGFGTWTFVAGVISQTDATADSAINYNAAAFASLDFVMEADIKIVSGQDAGVTAQAALSTGTPSTAATGGSGITSIQGPGGTLISDGTGDEQPINVADWLDGGNLAAPFPTAIAQDEWHTLRVVSNALRLLVYLDGVYVFSNEQVTGGNSADPGPPLKSCDQFAVAAVGLAQFRNPKVWTRPLPA